MRLKLTRWIGSVAIVVALGCVGVGTARAAVSPEAEAAQEAALKLWDAGKGEEALGELDKALGAAPRWLDALLLRAGIRASIGGGEGIPAAKAVEMLSGAISDLNNALKLKPPKAERKKIAATRKMLKKQLRVAKKKLKKSSVAVSDQKGTCDPGMLKGPDTAGHCCWPDQEWSTAKARCIGLPKCPEGMMAEGDACATPKKVCANGQVASAVTSNNCCWAGQEWSKRKSRCIGTPECPSGMKAQGELCETPCDDKCRAAERRQAAEEQRRQAAAQQRRQAADEAAERRRREAARTGKKRW